ncbi:YlmC/YmxH family sporulation protein [Bacillus marinisedimentorum]|uniref:YlmC/YmxH family sporulation protein n=1 Tax=Bacillus marinisedimentorum TaxID=1821260 RepID=UPI0008722D28|nr:YlmC/YmxH family sporulation protein [Bacillus marinisedimentorum]
MIKISEFRIKDVINVSDGRRLGAISDIELNTSTGKIDAIVIPAGERKMGLFGKDSEIVIPWHNIVKIGNDVILVRHYPDQGISDE